MALLATVAIIAVSLLGARVLLTVPGLWDGLVGPPRPAGADDVPKAVLWSLAIFQLLAVALTLIAAMLLGGRLREVLALGAAPSGWRAYAGAILAMACLQVVLASVQHSLLEHDMLTDLRPFAGLVRGPDWMLAAAVLGVGAPLSEELLFRGFLQSALAKSRLGFWGAALVSTLLWAAMHAGYSLVGLAEVFFIGLLLSWLLWRTGSLRVPIFCHAVYNSLIVLVMWLVELPS
jgi:membrane protease YdiL (CAAX protease family)